MDVRTARLTRQWPAVAGIAALIAAIPVLFTGPGTDLDTGAVLQSDQSILDGDYTASRAPGAPVHEAAVGALDAIGGTTLTNLGSLVMAVVLVVSLVVLLRREGVPHAELAAAFVVANPWFQIAATSTVDFVWAMALTTLGALVLRSAEPVARRGERVATRPVLAGALFGLAIGCRMSTIAIVAAALLADLVTDRKRRGLVVGATVTAAVVAVVLFLPPFFAAGSSLAFADNDFATSTPLNHLGRSLAKNFSFFGPYAWIGFAFALPAVIRSFSRWRTSWPLRFGLIGFGLTQLLFLRFPWKMGHLIPALVCLGVVLAVALAQRPVMFAVLVGLQLLLGIVNVELFQPDSPNDARGATFDVDVRWGPFVIDTQCRRQDPDAYIDNDQARLEAVWNCAKPWGTGP